MRRLNETAGSDMKNSKQPFSLGPMRLSALEKGEPMEILPPVRNFNTVAEISTNEESQGVGVISSATEASPSSSVNSVTNKSVKTGEENKKKTESGAASEIKNLLASLTRTAENATQKLPRKASDVVKRRHKPQGVSSYAPSTEVKSTLEIHESHSEDLIDSKCLNEQSTEYKSLNSIEQVKGDAFSVHEYPTDPPGLAKSHSHPSLVLLNQEETVSNNVINKEELEEDLPSLPSDDLEKSATDLDEQDYKEVDDNNMSEGKSFDLTEIDSSLTKRPKSPPPRPPPPANIQPVLETKSTPTSKANQLSVETIEPVTHPNNLFRNGLVLGGISLLILVIAVRISSYLFGFVCGLVLGVLLHFLYTYFNTPNQLQSSHQPYKFVSLRDLPPPLIPEYVGEENLESHVGVGGNGFGSMTNLTTTTLRVGLQEDDLDCSSSYIYKTWMNQLSEYNADNYHLHRTHTVLVTLDGCTMKLERPKERVSKRVLFNDSPFNPSGFVSTRVCNLLHAKVSLKPDMLVHKRQWSKKYPICIQLCQDYNKRYMSDIASDLHRRNNNTNDNASVVSTPGVPEEEDTLSSPEKEVSLAVYLFCRTAREKEHWFRLFQSATLGKPLIVSVAHLVKMSLPKHSVLAPDQRKKRSVSTTYKAGNDTVNLGCGDTVTSAVETSSSMAEGAVPTSTQVPQTSSKTPRPTSEALLSAYVRHMAKFMPADYLLKASLLQQFDINYITCETPYLWINALMGRLLWDFLREPYWTELVKRKIQAKLNKVHLPYFIDGITLLEVEFGTELPVLRRAHRAYLDSFGLWIDLDVAYAGGFSMTVETKINPLKLRHAMENPNPPQQPHNEVITEQEISSSDEDVNLTEGEIARKKPTTTHVKRSAAKYSDEEDSPESSGSRDYGASADEDEEKCKTRKGRLLHLVNRVVKSPYMAKAMQNKYVKKGMEIVQRTSLVLKVDVEFLSGTVCLNIPPPPTDRLWYGFRNNPQLKLCARPRVGDRNITFARIVEFIETKMVSELQEVLVYPNLDDIVIPLLLDNNPRFYGHCH